ncbi:MAG TPA: ribonuclease E/G [Stellaceae bacterium]|nr:ribonuclease E/G [Stellaceae bacterium]
MSKRMLIDAAHPEEIRVAILNGSRLEEFDVEAALKRQIKGNIYLARVTRVEPSLQAAFVEYGGNRHGFLAFNEIHPDYYRIPVSDRADFKSVYEPRKQGDSSEADGDLEPHAADAVSPEGDGEPHDEAGMLENPAQAAEASADVIYDTLTPDTTEREVNAVAATPLDEPGFESREAAPETHSDSSDEANGSYSEESPSDDGAGAPVLDISAAGDNDGGSGEPSQQIEVVPQVHTLETVGGEDEETEESEEAEAPRPRFRSHRHYKIQEVIKRRQIMLVQVTKEERGNKGAALTTYLSLAGRYCVLMPNTPRGGGVSRKITSMQDRRRLKDLMSDLSVPDGMGVIVRTAGSERTKPEIKRDFEYLMRLWDEIRDLTLKSTAPALVYEEGNLIKRSIRDLYARDIEEVVVDGEEAFRAAKTFMKMLMPSHAKKVKLYRDPSVPLFHRYQAEGQIDAIMSPVVQLRSGGYIVINPTEALVAIDVNSGRATRERNIEETALKTNLEAAEEVARQLRLRDLAGLIVIDFIDMEEGRNNGQVERRVKEAMRHDRARIQIGRISPFGLMELSRQRLRPSVLEASTEICPHCSGTGHVRSTESTALHILRAIEEEGMRRRTAEVSVAMPTSVALYLLNHKRNALSNCEKRYGLHVAIGQDDTLMAPAFRLDRGRSLTPEEIAALPLLVAPEPIEEDEDDTIVDDEAEMEAGSDAHAVAGPPVFDGAEEEEDENGSGTVAERSPQRRDDERGGRRRNRRGRGRHDDRDRNRGDRNHQPRPEAPAPASEGADTDEMPIAAEGDHVPAPLADDDGQGERKRRRRGRRGGRRRRREHGEGGLPETGHTGMQHEAEHDPMAVALAPVMEATDIETVEETVAETHVDLGRRADQDVDIAAEQPLAASPEPAAPAPRAEAPPPARALEPEPQPQPEPEPAGPPKRGWWRRR